MHAQLQNLLQRKFVRDTLILQAGKIGVAALGFITVLIVPARLGVANYGIWALAQSFLAIILTFDLTGLETSINTLLGKAWGKQDGAELREVMSAYIKMAFLRLVVVWIVLYALGPLILGWLYKDTKIDAGQLNRLAFFLAIAILLDSLYNLGMTTFSTRREMGQVAVLQIANQFVLTVCFIAGALLNPTPEGMLVARLAYSGLTCLMVWWVYQRQRIEPMPSIRSTVQTIRRASYRPFMGFGFMTALDKNIASLFTQIPLQVLGILGGTAAVSHLQFALRGIAQVGLLVSAVFENLQVIVPQAIGRGDYKGLKHNLTRVLLALSAGSLLIYGAFVVLAPMVVPLLFSIGRLSAEWLPVIPLLQILAVYGVATMVGGVFGPVYRALNLTRWAIVSKITALVFGLAIGLPLILRDAQSGGAWMVNFAFTLNAILIGWVSLRALWRQASQTA